MVTHHHLLWWMHQKISRRDPFPLCIDRHMVWEGWKRFWQEEMNGGSLIPSLLQYLATGFLCTSLRTLCSLCLSDKALVLRMIQHPYRAATSNHDDDRLTLGIDMVTVCLYSNVLYYVADYLLGQLQCYLLFYKDEENVSSSLSSRRTALVITRAKFTAFCEASWTLLCQTARRYWYSCVGAGIGSVVWPGWGTLLGLGLGDGWASWRENDSNETFPQPASITDLYSLFLSTVWKSERKQRSTSKTQTSHCADDGGDDDDGDDDDNEYIGKELNEARLCGCCQIVTFSSNPYNHRLGDGGTPISSRTCGHSICKSCVQNCHVMVMERTMNYEEWMKCPMCNAPKAFHSQDHLINRSLCQVLAWIDGTYISSKSTKS